MLIVVMLSDFLLSNYTMRVIEMSINLSVMLCLHNYAECHYAECHYAECHYAESHNASAIM